MELEDGHDWGDEDYWRSPWVEGNLEPDWTFQLSTSALSLDWITEGDDWLHFLGIAIGQPGSVGAKWTTRGGTKRHPGTLFSPYREKSCIWCGLVNGKLKIEVWGLGTVDADVTRRWQRAIESATASLLSAPVEVWVAAIESDDLHSPVQQLMNDGSVGTLTLSSSRQPLVSRRRSRHSFTGYELDTSFPIEVRGSSRVDTSMSNPYALIALRHLCAVLTLAWESHWTLASRPVSIDSWTGIPSRIHGDLSSQEMGLTDGVSPVEVRIEPWMDEAIRSVAENAILRQALLMYDEAIALKHEHPSLSLVCITSALEAIAESRFGPLDRCDACQQHTGATRRFGMLLSEVVGADEARHLASAYSARSETVHSAALHERERAFGHFHPDSHLANSSMAFWATRLKLDRACRLLLLQELGAPAEILETEGPKQDRGHQSPVAISL